MGSKVPGDRIPSADKLSTWGYKVLTDWNVDDSNAVTALKESTITSEREVSVLSETLNQAVRGEDELYFNYYITGNDVDVATISSEVEEGKNTILQSNNEGYSLILVDAKVTHVSTSAEKTSKSSSSWVWALVGSIIGMCVTGGLVAVYLTIKKRSDNDDEMNNFIGLEAIEVKNAISDGNLDDVVRARI